MDGMLSQEEINALLSGMNEDNGSSSENETKERLSATEEDAIGEISNISMGNAATTLSTLVNKRVVITAPKVSYATISRLSLDFDKPCVFIQISYKEGLDGQNILILKESDVKIITDLMMGGDGANITGELSELHLSAISEAMNQMMGSASTSISSMIQKKVDISPPSASIIDLNDTFSHNEISDILDTEFVLISFKMEIEGLVDSHIMQLYPLEFARELYYKFLKEESVPTKQSTIQQQPAAVPKQAPQQTSNQRQEQPAPAMNQYTGNMGGMPMMGAQQGMNYGVPMPEVNIQPAQFQAFNTNVNPLSQEQNIDLIMDVPLEVTVELGRTNKTIKEILDFSPGTIIELNKLAGEPIDVLVNGKFVAKGEVVVIEENFGIRVTEIIR